MKSMAPLIVANMCVSGGFSHQLAILWPVVKLVYEMTWCMDGLTRIVDQVCLCVCVWGCRGGGGSPSVIRV
jgi:hypothetical protein